MPCLVAGSLLLSSPARPEEPPITAPVDWHRTFNEDFDHLDLTRWMTRFPWGGRYVPGSKEEQFYVDPALGLNTFTITDGILSITADRASPDLGPQIQGRHYTS